MNIPRQAWLENIHNERLPLGRTSTIGRAPGNSIVLASNMISRRHALIHAQSECEFWLVDLGSRNGTLHNFHRVQRPAMLHPGDQIQLGDFRFVFRLDIPSEAEPVSDDALSETVLAQNISDLWIVVADVEGYGALSQRIPPDALAQKIGAWLLQCTEWVERYRGNVDKYMGDGFLAYWPAKSTTADIMIAAVSQLDQWQSEGSLRFRWILHRATMPVRSSPFGGDCLMGNAVIFAFRMEKVAAELKLPRLISEPAAADLRGRIPLRDAGKHEVKGYERLQSFYTY